MATTSTLEQQLQEYRKKLQAFKGKGENNSSRSLGNNGGGTSGASPGAAAAPTTFRGSNTTTTPSASASATHQQPQPHQQHQPQHHHHQSQKQAQPAAAAQQQQSRVQRVINNNNNNNNNPPVVSRASSARELSPASRSPQTSQHHHHHHHGHHHNLRRSNSSSSHSSGTPSVGFNNSMTHTTATTTTETSQDSAEKGNNNNKNILFNYDDDFEQSASEAEEEEELTWRSDPAKSLSDWTIRVSNRETRETVPYHVHRNVLAVGPRKSEYFVRFFLSHDRLSKQSTSTEIWLESVAAAAMPPLLDYMYSSEGRVVITTERAVGLRHLSQFFGMRALHKKVMAFITRDLNMVNLRTYYQHSVSVDDQKVSELASDHCGQHVMDISADGQDDDFLGLIDPTFFRRILSSHCIDSHEKQLHCSQLLAAYCTQHATMLDDQDFVRLTDEHTLPVVHYKAALTLMEMEADLVLLGDENEDNALTSLQDRCLRDLTEHWEELSQMRPTELTRICSKLPSPVVTEIMVRSLGHAKQRVDEQETALQKQQASAPPASSSSRNANNNANTAQAVAAAERNLKRDYEAKLTELKREHQQTLDKIKGEFETSLVKMREAVVEKDKFITEYWNELKRFERVPNAPDGKMVQSNPNSANILRMPVIGNQPVEGLILSKPKGAGKFPLFVYKGAGGGGNANGENGRSAAPPAAPGQQPSHVSSSTSL